jgi:hypothetical protein
MGGSFNPITQVIDCNGQRVTVGLDQVFKSPGSPKYGYAKAHNTFNKVPNAKKDNWKDLFIAYVVAGVDVGNEWEAWVAYLRSLGAGEDNEPGPQSISTIANMRFNALINDTGIVTKTHPHGRVETSPGEINSPCPL